MSSWTKQKLLLVCLLISSGLALIQIGLILLNPSIFPWVLTVDQPTPVTSPQITPSPSPLPFPPLPADLTDGQKQVELSRRLTQLVVQQDPSVAFAYLKQQMDGDKAVLRVCHGLVHSIGNAAYQKYGSFEQAVMFQDDVCGSGYLHGVVEMVFANTKDVFKEIQTVCENQSSNDNQSFCYHGVGHGLMYFTENDLPRSITLCQTYTDLSASIRCTEGVYMENFSTTEDSLHTSNFLRPTEPFYPCAQQPAAYKDSCYFYTAIYYLHLRPQAYVSALESCMTAEYAHRAACARGVGSRIMKENLKETALAGSLCDQGPAFLRQSCVEGLLSYHLVNFHSKEQSVVMCSQLTPPDQEWCRAALELKVGSLAE